MSRRSAPKNSSEIARDVNHAAAPALAPPQRNLIMRKRTTNIGTRASSHLTANGGFTELKSSFAPHEALKDSPKRPGQSQASSSGRPIGCVPSDQQITFILIVTQNCGTALKTEFHRSMS
jgi:hypothetical protein